MSGGGQDAAAFCANLVRGHDFARYASTLFVSPDERRALLALYAFNVEIVRVRDQITQPLPGEVRLKWWSEVLAGEGDGGVEGNPVVSELLLAIRHFRLPTEPLTRLIFEHQFDLYNDPMPTLAALEGYVADTSSTLFALAARIAAAASAEIDHAARHAGLAQGFAQVIAALPRDTARRQLFVPVQLLAKQDIGIEAIFAAKQTPPVRAALDQLIGEARLHLDTALSLLADIAPQARAMFLPLAVVRHDLGRMSRADSDPFVPRTASRLSTLWTLWRASKSSAFRR
jgi:15-cis-phytoene synthase